MEQPARAQGDDGAAAALLPASLRARYVDVALLGEGGQGTVLRARDARRGGTVALKVVPTADGAGARLRVRLKREAAALAGVNHPNLVRLRELHDEDEATVLVTDEVKGDTLATLIESGVIGRNRAVELAAGLADGLAAAHAAGLVHRDVTPRNVLVDPSGRPVLIDFGLVAFVGPDSPTAMTRSGEVLGSLGYLAPEQLRGAAADARTDLWQLGATLHELLTGAPPYDAGPLAAWLRSGAGAPPAPPPLSGLPPGLAAVVRRAVALDLGARYSTAADFRDACRAWLAGPEASLAAAEPTRRRRPIRAPAKDAPPPRRDLGAAFVGDATQGAAPPRLRTFAGVGVTLLAAGLVLALWLAPRAGRPDAPGTTVVVGPSAGGAEATRPMLEAAGRGDGPTVMAQLGRGVPVDARGDFDATALHRAAHGGHVSVVSLLLHAGAAPGPRDRDGRTPLHAAAAQGHSAVVSLLLASGAPADARDGTGATPAELARAAGQGAVAALLATPGRRSWATSTP